MSRHAATASTDPARTSPKVKWAAAATAILTALGAALIPAVQAIPRDTWESLGPAGIPLSILVGGGLASLAAYLKHDPARDPLPPQVDSPADTGEYASNLVHPDQIPSDSLILTEDQAITDDPVELEQPVGDDPVARLARQVSA